MPIRIREVVDIDDPALRGAYRLLEEQFHREERVEFNDWTSTLGEMSAGLLTDITWHLFVAQQGDDIVGFVSGAYLGNVNIGVIGYLASVAEVRSRGIGTRLRARLRKQFERDALHIRGEPLQAIIGEVALDNPWLRTLAARDNVLVLDFRYFQPGLYAGDRASPFALYYESLREPRTRIPVAELRRILYTVWRRVYRISRPLERPAFRAMLRSFGTRRSIGSLQLDKDTR